jgi:ribonucleoside-diphosphate reductase alpha chain
MNQDIYVIKQNSSKELLDISKIQKQVQVACKGIEDVSPSMIEVRAQLEFYDGISTKTIDETLLKAMVNLIDESEDPEINNVNYQYVAGRQRNKILRKHVYGQFKPPHLYDIVKKNIDNFIYTEDLLKWYTKDEWNILNSHLDHSYDENLEYAAIEQYVDKYLARNRVTKQVYETPSVCHMVIAATAFHMETENE